MTLLRRAGVHAAIVTLALAVYLPFINQALYIDSDMLVYVTRQTLENPLDPPLGEYGKNMIHHSVTDMPDYSVYKRSAHPPFLSYLLLPVEYFGGGREWPYHAALFFFYLAAIYGGWYLFGLLFSGRLQVYGTLIWAVCPALLVNAHAVMWDIPITAMILWALALFLDGLKRGRPTLFIACGLVTGIAAVTKSNSVPLYFLIGGYLLLKRHYRYLFYWLPGAMVFPLFLIAFNLIVIGKIQYLASGQFHPVLGDIRYRMERIVTLLGGSLLLPVWWYWLMARTQAFRQFMLIVAPVTFVWSVLLWRVLAFPVWFCVTYWIFSTAGCWIWYRMLLWWKSPGDTSDKRDWFLISLFAVLYSLIMLFLPMSCARYMLPVFPCAIVLMLYYLQKLGTRERRWWEITNLVSVLVLSVGLSVSDHLLVEADRKLPSDLIRTGCDPSRTWYYGRLSFDYYLFHQGFQNVRTSDAIPRVGDFAVEESIPPDYKLAQVLPDSISLEPIDTLRYYQFPLRTRRPYGGFYGESRIPYFLDWHSPLREFVLYRLK